MSPNRHKTATGHEANRIRSLIESNSLPGLSYDMIASFDVPADATGLKLSTKQNKAFTVDLDI